MNTKQKRQAIVFPKEQKMLEQLGENIRLAMKRRKITQTMIAERTGLSKPTLRNIERGESTVSIGHYLRVLAVLGLAEDLAKVASDDDMGRKLQDIELLKASRSSNAPSRRETTTSAQASESGGTQRIQSLMALAKTRANKEDNRGKSEQDGPSTATSNGEDT